MSELTPELLQKISVSAVESFLNYQIPLSEGLAKQASDHRLNSEQIKRGVEAVNSIAYLKVLSLSKDDRTVEFPLCKYAEVMDIVANSDLEQGPQNSKSFFDIFTSMPTSVQTGGMQKEASATQESTVDPASAKVYLTKVAAVNERQAQELRYKSAQVAEDLVKIAKDLKGDPQWIEKLSSVTTPTQFKELSILVNGSAVDHRDMPQGFFKEASVKQAMSLSNMYAEAKDLMNTIADREKTAQVAKEHLEKAAFLPALAGVAGRVAGSAIKGAGSLATRAVKSTGRGMASGVKNTFTSTGKMRTPPLKSTGTSKASILKPAVGKKSVLGTLGSVAFAGLDATMYEPGTTASGRSKDVWTALRRQ